MITGSGRKTSIYGSFGPKPVIFRDRDAGEL
jgi:hypothetical protein